jgi:vacuolar-type H+-ATPase subunit H
MIYDNIEMNNVVGVIFISDKAVTLNKLKMDILNGTANLSGKFDAKNPEEPTADFDFNIANIDIQKAYSTFGILEKLVPLAEKTRGNFSTTLTLSTLLDKELMPIYNSMNGEGKLNTSSIIIENVNTLVKLADVLKMPDLKRISSDPINLTYEITDGRLIVNPFDLKYKDISANLGGSTGFDETIDYDMKLTVPRDKFGGQANAVLDNLISQANSFGSNFSVGENIDVNVKIGGTLTNPQLKTGLAGASGNMKDDLKKKAQEALEGKVGEELEKRKAEAKAEADKILADAKAQADKLMSDAQAQADQWNKAAADAAVDAKKEAENQANKIIEDAKKNGRMAEIAAKAATDKLVDEANRNADKIVQEAKSKSDNLMMETQKQADKINSDAQVRANNILEGK